jgi:5-methylcytosine-specific restriction protein B
MLSVLETEKNIVSRFPKNDFGRGGAWDFIWGAFYPKGGKRIRDAQLYIWINKDILEYGFSLGASGTVVEERFKRNLNKYNKEINKILKDDVTDYFNRFGVKDSDIEETSSFQEWIENINNYDVNICRKVEIKEVLGTDREEFIDDVTKAFITLMPLVYLSIEDTPMESIIDFINGQTTGTINLEYPLPQISEETSMNVSELTNWISAIKRKKQAIIYGPPGTGKTFVAEKLAKNLIGGSDGFYEVIQFHPSYSYEDFIGGIRPRTDENGNLSYPIVPGRFLTFCREAQKRDGNCVLIIDEINRANLSRVFGELMYLLEYRNQTVPLAIDGRHFSIPSNVYIIGTMNTADRTIALVDHALRRRFAFLKLEPKYEILERFHQDNDFDVTPLINVLKRLNNHIEDHFEVGISFFLRDNLQKEIEAIWTMEIEPYLEEYFFDQPEKVKDFKWEKIKDEIMG